VDGLGLAQALPDQIEVSPWCRDALGRFLLERMKDVQDARKANRVDGTVGVAEQKQGQNSPLSGAAKAIVAFQNP
jgi:hypothetical protein